MLNNHWFSKVAGASIALLLFPSTAWGQVGVSPLSIETKADRGQAQGIITVTNTSSKVSRVRIYAEPFTYNRDTGFQTLPSSPNNLTPYLQFSPRELTILPGESRRVRLIGRLAPNLPEGEYRAVVFNETLNESKDGSGNNVTLVTRIGVTFYVRKGTQIASLAVDGASFNTEQKQIQLLVHNTGKATARPNLIWTLLQGETVVKTGVVDSTGIIAESDRNILLNYPNKEQPTLKPGTYELRGELVWGEDNKTKLPFKINITITAQNAAASEVNSKK